MVNIPDPFKELIPFSRFSWGLTQTIEAMREQLESAQGAPIGAGSLLKRVEETNRWIFSYRANSVITEIENLCYLTESSKSPLLIIVPREEDRVMVQRALEILHFNKAQQKWTKTEGMSLPEYLRSFKNNTSEIGVVTLDEFKQQKVVPAMWNRFGHVSFFNITSFPGKQTYPILKQLDQDIIQTTTMLVWLSPTYVTQAELWRHIENDYGGKRLREIGHWHGSIQYHDIANPESVLQHSLSLRNSQEKMIIYVADTEQARQVESELHRLWVQQADTTILWTKKTSDTIQSFEKDTGKKVLIVPKAFAGYIESPSSIVVVCCPVTNDELIKIDQSALISSTDRTTVHFVSSPEHMPRNVTLHNNLGLDPKIAWLQEQIRALAKEATEAGATASWNGGTIPSWDRKWAQAILESSHEIGKEDLSTKSMSELGEAAVRELSQQDTSDRADFIFLRGEKLQTILRRCKHLKEYLQRLGLRTSWQGSIASPTTARTLLTDALEQVAMKLWIHPLDEAQYIELSKEYLATEEIHGEFEALDTNIHTWRTDFSKYPPLAYIYRRKVSKGAMWEISITDRVKLVDIIFGKNERDWLKTTVLWICKTHLGIQEEVDVYLYQYDTIRKIADIQACINAHPEVARWYNMEKWRYVEWDDTSNPSQFKLKDVVLLAKILFWSGADRNYRQQLEKKVQQDIKSCMRENAYTSGDDIVYATNREIRAQIQAKDGENYKYPYLMYYIYQGYKDVYPEEYSGAIRNGQISFTTPAGINNQQVRFLCRLLWVEFQTERSYLSPLQEELKRYARSRGWEMDDIKAIAKKIKRKWLAIPARETCPQWSKYVHIFCQSSIDKFVDKYDGLVTAGEKWKKRKGED